MSADVIRDEASDSGDSAVAELNRALEKNPELRATTPPPGQDEWEDFEKLLAENPELAAPVPSTAPAANAVFYSMNVWACKHESEPEKTDIDRVPHDDEEDGVNPATGEFYEDALLINCMNTICPDCIRKWTMPEGDEAALNQGMDQLEIDDSLDKNKDVPDHGSDPEDAEYDDDYASDYSDRSRSPPGSPVPGHYDQGDDSDDDGANNDRNHAANNAARPAGGDPPPY